MTEQDGSSKQPIWGRVVGAIVACLFGIPFVVFAVVALTSRFGASSGDPHGYALIFATLLALALAIPTAIALPFAFPRASRLKAGLIGAAVLLAISIGLFAALLSA